MFILRKKKAGKNSWQCIGEPQKSLAWDVPALALLRLVFYGYHQELQFRKHQPAGREEARSQSLFTANTTQGLVPVPTRSSVNPEMCWLHWGNLGVENARARTQVKVSLALLNIRRLCTSGRQIGLVCLQSSSSTPGPATSKGTECQELHLHIEDILVGTCSHRTGRWSYKQNLQTDINFCFNLILPLVLTSKA